ncbi:hypothetical protein SAMN05444000_11866 [Shimia gijangensis]|uniref:Uncharacterized protein n=1 Tax=Shimia gijangensis TaxID=1470563 RepID=A0A1M6PJT5_9RHOB|nr:hypothetical protein [Shimia gijangensis]SHK08154.1 hypothetical protein SAMN05444000_11866 [Shimia gijangensis]
MNCFKHSFGDHLEQICRLRSKDSVFAEICRDYETLMELMPLDADDPALADVNESLVGLEQEIWLYLGPPDGRTSDAPSTRRHANHKQGH